MNRIFDLQVVESLANQFTRQHLDTYLEEVKQVQLPQARKEVNDALWGTIGLSPIEVVVLDSPLLQRLRYVRQLGVVHWVYPGAIHTRFEHTLGVLHQVHHLTATLNSLGKTYSANSDIIDPSYIQILRLCALFHDTGHAAFSHVSEAAIHGLDPVITISADFSRKFHVEPRKLSEIFAYYVVRSPSMHQFLEYLLDSYSNAIVLDRDRKKNLELTVDIVSNAIIGKKIDDRIPQLHELISGPFDADKLDYFVRDARLAGTPSVLDITRLVQKLTVQHFRSCDLPEEIASHVNATDQPHHLFGLKWSGVALLDELSLARVLLYAKIYRYPKVIAIEQMLRGVIETIGKIVSAEPLITLLYSYPDDVLLNMSLDALALALKIDKSRLSPDDHNRLNCAASLLKAIKDRRLWVRAFCLLQRSYSLDPVSETSAQKDGFLDFREDIEHPEGREKFKKELISEVRQILEIICPETRYLSIPFQLESMLMVHTLNQIPGSSQVLRAYLMPSSGKPIPFREYDVNRHAWSESYLSDRPAGYVFSSAEIADAVYLGIEKIIRMKYDVRLPDSAMEVSKRDVSKIQACKKLLSSKGYYRGTPYDLRPLPDRLRKADIEVFLDEFSGTLCRYSEPTCASACCKANPIAPKEKIINWLRQFDNDQHIDCAIQILRRFRMLTREDTTAAIKEFIEKNPDFRGARVIPFGAAKDSAAIHTYFAADLLGTFISECMTLNEAAKATQDLPLIFVDDFVASGSQGEDILAAGFGIPELRRNLGEQRAFFGEQEIELLKRVKVGFVFTAAWDDGIEAISSAAKNVGINAIVFRKLDEASIPFAFENNIFEDVSHDIVESFKAKCEEIGTSLVSIKDDGSDQSEEKINRRKLGYGNRAMLLASSFNVPSQTLTAIWASGNFDGVPWNPIMTRRKKH